MFSYDLAYHKHFELQAMDTFWIFRHNVGDLLSEESPLKVWKRACGDMGAAYKIVN